MLRSLYAGVSGLRNNQTRMDVIGNNIANVNTVAFKSSRALFKPQFYVTDTPGGVILNAVPDLRVTFAREHRPIVDFLIARARHQ